MEQEISELKEEISLLTKKVEILENNEKKRKAFGYVKILIKIILTLAIIYGVYRGYEYVVKEIPNIMEEKIKDLNPFRTKS